MVIIPRLHFVSKGRIAEQLRELVAGRIQSSMGEDRVEAGPVSLDVGVTIVVQEQVDLADAPQNLVDFNPEDVRPGEVHLRTVNLDLRLAVVLAVNVVPDLQESFQKEATAARRGIDNVVILTDAEHSDCEPGELPHREILGDFEALEIAFPPDRTTQLELVEGLVAARDSQREALDLMSRAMMAFNDTIDGRGDEALPEVELDTASEDAEA